jgi:hypothetical protein
MDERVTKVAKETTGIKQSIDNITVAGKDKGVKLVNSNNPIKTQRVSKG